MIEVLTTAIIDFGLYSLFVLIYTLVGAYQNINIWGMRFDWKLYVNGLVKWLVLGGAVVGSTVGAFLLLAQAEKQGIDLVDAETVAPRVIFGVVILASAVMLGKIIAKLATTLGVSEQALKQIQETAKTVPEDKPLPVFFPDTTPKEVDEYVKAKLQEEQEGGIGTFYSVPTGSYQEFKNAVNGNGYDIDNYYGWQCWDGTALLWQQFGKSLVTGNGLAIGCWDLKRDVNKYDLFTLVTDVNSLQLGDVVVMRPNHIGFFDGYNGGYMRILGQNQGGRANSAGGSAFNVVNIAKSSFAGAFRLKKWATAPAPTPAPAPRPTKSIDEVAKEVLRGDWGNGDARTARLRSAGYDPNAVQAKVNQLLAGSPAPAKKSIDEVAREALRGDWGNGDDRKRRLTEAGYDYTAVQNKVNQLLAGSNGVASAPAPAFKVGDVVVPTRRVSYNGSPLTQYDNSYTISELKGDRAVLMARGQVWSAMNTKDIRKA